MNDRYLYKAKIVEYTGNNVNVGEWVVGCLVVNESATDKFKYRIQPIEDGFLFAPPINPSTSCQCTGLKDKNGKMIWENDIVKVHDDEEPCLIEWGEDTARWHMTQYGSYIYDFDNYCSYEVEVIGSAIDNPELLEVGE